MRIERESVCLHGSGVSHAVKELVRTSTQQTDLNLIQRVMLSPDIFVNKQRGCGSC